MMSVMMGIMIQTAVLVAAILVVRNAFREKLHAYLKYGLWLLVALRLVIPVNLVDSPLSVLRLENVLTGRLTRTISGTAVSGDVVSADTPAETTSDAGKGTGAGGDILPAEGQDAGDLEQGGHGTVNSVQAPASAFFGQDSLAGSGGSVEYPEKALREAEEGSVQETVVRILAIVWAAGSLAVGGCLTAAHFRFQRRLYRTRKICRKNLSGSEPGKGFSKLPVYRVDKLEAPCLAGFLRPAVYIGSDMKIDSDDFRYTVVHEQMHYLHGDHIWAFLRAVLVAVYWFHPFVWIAASASARDGEIACDYGTIRRLGDTERLRYGEMLLKLSRKNHGERIYSYGVMLRPGRSEIKERIIRLADGNGARMSAGVLTVLLMFVLAGCAFTGASQNVGDPETAGHAGADAMQTAGNETDGSQNTADGENGDGSGSILDGAGGAGDGNASGGTRGSGSGSVSDGADGTGDGNASEREEGAGNEAGFDPEESIREPRQLPVSAAEIYADTEFGADGPALDYAGRMDIDGARSSVIIFHDYFGLVIFDLSNREILRSLDLAAIGCNFTQGDNACQVAVSSDGTKVWLHPRARQYMFRYEVEEDRLWQIPLVKTFETDLEAEDLFDRYLVSEEQYEEWHSNYLYEEYKDERGLQTAYIYLYISSDASNENGLRFCDLQCVWDDMVFILWEEDSALPDRAAGEFPYLSDGVKADVLLIYEEPCAYDRIADTFGQRVHPVTGEVRVHEGIDYVAEAGTEITAAADGTVYETGFLAEHGNYVVLLHPNGDMTYYFHCRDITVSEGETVKRGDGIATVGNTGRSTGTHLHFALSRDGEFVDPAESM